MGCTIGAKVFEPGAEFVLFKNKDFRRASFDDTLVIRDDLFGVAGLSIPPKDAPRTEDVLAGFSIGVNARGVAACNSHIRSMENTMDYDVLTEAAVNGTSSAREACEKVLSLAANGGYNWGNIIVADPKETAIIEIGETVAHARGLREVARANGQLLKSRSAPCPRAMRAARMLSECRALEDVMALCSSHEGEADGTNICSHADRNTVYSYIIRWRVGELELFVCQGHPCEGRYVRIPLRFPLSTASIYAVYPTRNVGASGG